jgi:hypothetical protein
MKLKQLTTPLFVFLFGGLIYVLFRTDSIRFFDYLTYVGLDESLSIIRSITLPMNQFIPEWVIYSLPDGLWLFSFSLLVNLIWSREDRLRFWFWTLLFPCTAIIWELGQAFQVFSGTFDWTDLTVYSIILLYFLTINQTKYYEQTT